MGALLSRLERLQGICAEGSVSLGLAEALASGLCVTGAWRCSASLLPELLEGSLPGE